MVWSRRWRPFRSQCMLEEFVSGRTWLQPLTGKYALLFSFPGNEGITLQIQSSHLSYVAPSPLQICHWRALTEAASEIDHRMSWQEIECATACGLQELNPSPRLCRKHPVTSWDYQLVSSKHILHVLFLNLTAEDTRVFPPTYFLQNHRNFNESWSGATSAWSAPASPGICCASFRRMAACDGSPCWSILS